MVFITVCSVLASILYIRSDARCRLSVVEFSARGYDVFSVGRFVNLCRREGEEE